MADAEGLGDVGELSGPGKDYYPIWAIVEKAGVPLKDIEENWTLERINGFMDYLSMKADYKSVWGEYFQQQAARENKD